MWKFRSPRRLATASLHRFRAVTATGSMNYGAWKMKEMKLLRGNNEREKKRHENTKRLKFISIRTSKVKALDFIQHFGAPRVGEELRARCDTMETIKREIFRERYRERYVTLAKRDTAAERIHGTLDNGTAEESNNKGCTGNIPFACKFDIRSSHTHTYKYMCKWIYRNTQRNIVAKLTAR